MNKRKKFVGISVAVLCVSLLVWFMIKPQQKPAGSGQSAGSVPAEAVSPAAGLMHEPVTGGSDEQQGDGVSGEMASSQGSSTPDPLVQELQDLLDDDANREQTLTKAIALSRGTVQQQWAAINAFRWLGGREAVKALIRLRKEAYPELADEAGRVLTHLLTEGLYSGGTALDASGDAAASPGQDSQAPLDEQGKPDLSDVTQFDESIWEQAIREAPAASDREELLILLSAFPGTKSVPVLLNLLESDNPQIREHALEYLEFVTYGEKITSRQQGEDWLAKNGALEEFVP